MTRFDNFTESAQRALQLARDEALQLGHVQVGAEHILLGLVREGEGLAAMVLLNLDFDIAKARATLKSRVEAASGSTAQVGLNDGAKTVLRLAVDEARRLNDHHIGTEHLLLGLASEGEGSRTLEAFGLSLDQVRRQVIDLVSRSAASGSQPTGGEATAASSRLRYDKFTERARNAMRYAQEEAQQRFNHNYIGTEHLLLGLLREPQGVAAKVLVGLGVDVNKVRSAVEFIIGHGDRTVTGDIGLTPRAKTVIQLSVDEARRLGHDSIGTGHLLLGLVREGEGLAAGIIQSLGVSLHRVRERVMPLINRPEAAPIPVEAEPRPILRVAASRAARRPRRSRGGPTMSAQTPEEVHRIFAERFNAGDLDGLMALYEEDAALAPQPGQVVVGRQAARGALEAFLAMRGTLELKPRQVIATGDLALLISDWTLSATGEDGKPTTMGSTTSDVLRKQPDGSWLIAIDSPFGTT